MALLDFLKINRKTFFDPRAWIGYDYLKATTKIYINTAKDIFVVPTPARKETFEQAMRRLNLTEQDIQDRAASCRFFVGVYLVLAAISTCFAVYLLTVGGYFGAILAVAFTALVLAQAFRYHFWLFQIKNRKLGCTLAEWRKGRLNNSGSH